MLDAYAIRKAVPRIFLAVIGINISIYLCIAAVDVTNIIGHGVGNLIAGSFVSNDTFGDLQIDNNKTNTAAALGVPVMAVGSVVIIKFLTTGALFKSIAVAGGSVAGGAGLVVVSLLIPIVISIFFITLAILFTLIIRQALLIFLVVVAPVAFALSVLPGTEKYFKKWMDLFIKTLMVYPIIAVIFAMSTAMSAILLGTSGDSPGGIGLAKILGALVVAFAPLVMIPFAFKLAGGAISAVMNAASGATGSASQNAGKKFREWSHNPNSLLGKARHKNYQAREELGLTGSQVGSGLWAGMRNKNGQGFRSSYAQHATNTAQEKVPEILRQMNELKSNLLVKDDDDALEAGLFLHDDAGFALDAAGKRTTDRSKFVYRSEDEMAKFLMDKGRSEHDARQTAAALSRSQGTAGRQMWDTWAVQQVTGTGTGYETKYADGSDKYKAGFQTHTAADGSWIKEGDTLEAGTYVGGGQVQYDNMLNAAVGHDTAMKGTLIAGGRSKFAEARRMDTQSGFGTHLGVTAMLEEAAHHGGMIRERDEDGNVINKDFATSKMVPFTAAMAHEKVMKNVIETQGIGAFAFGRGNSVRGIVPFITERIATNEKAMTAAMEEATKPNVTRTKEEQIKLDRVAQEAERDYMESLASASALHEMMGQAAFEAQKAVSRDIINADVDGKTVFERIEEAQHSSTDFAGIKKGLGITYTQQARNAASLSEQASAQAIAEQNRMTAQALEKAGGMRPQGPTSLGPS